MVVGGGVVRQVGVEGTWGGLVLLSGSGWGGGEGGWLRPGGEAGWRLWESRRRCVLWVARAVWVAGDRGRVVGHGLGGPHASSKDHLPGVARTGAGAGLGAGQLGSARGRTRSNWIALAANAGSGWHMDLPTRTTLSPILLA